MPLVIELDESTIDRAIRTYPRILIEFFKNNCASCDRFADGYIQAAIEIKQAGIDVVFAKVDLDKNLGLKIRFDIHTFPRIILWDQTSGISVAKRYFKKFGLKTKRLVRWIKIQVESTTTYGPGCNLHQHTCRSGGCVYEQEVCDDVRHCSDGTDETYCYRADETTTTSTTIMTTTTTTMWTTPHHDVTGAFFFFSEWVSGHHLAQLSLLILKIIFINFC